MYFKTTVFFFAVIASFVCSTTATANVQLAEHPVTATGEVEVEKPVKIDRPLRAVDEEVDEEVDDDEDSQDDEGDRNLRRRTRYKICYSCRYYRLRSGRVVRARWCYRNCRWVRGSWRCAYRKLYYC